MGNNPVRYIDPTGHKWDDIFGFGGGGGGFLYALGTTAQELWQAHENGMAQAELAAYQLTVQMQLLWENWTPFEISGVAGGTEALGTLSTAAKAGYQFSNSEWAAASYMRQFGNVLLREAEGDIIPNAPQTSDIVLKSADEASKLYDVYSPGLSNSTTSLMDKIVDVALKKNGQAQGLVIDLSKAGASLSQEDVASLLYRIQNALIKAGKDVNITDIKVFGGK